MLIELDPVDRITADAIGTPGNRSFYLQARQGDRLITILLEKEQVLLLAQNIIQILRRIGADSDDVTPDDVTPDDVTPEDQMSLEEPIEPEFRAGGMEIAYHQDRDLFRLDIAETRDDAEIDPNEDEDGEEEPDEDEGNGDLEDTVAEGLAIAELEIEAI